MFELLKKILRQPRYWLLVLGVFIVIMLGALILPNIRLLIEVAKLSQVNFGEFLSLMFDLMGSIKSNFTVSSAINTILTAILFGVNISIMTFYIVDRKRKIEKSGVATSTIGFISGVLGIGCASCGSLLISILGLGGAIAFLPYGGQELGFVGVALLLLSIYLLLRKMSKPETCDIL